MRDKIIVVSTPEAARKLTGDRIAPVVKMDEFCQDPLGVPYEPPPLKCPCCRSEETSGARTARLSVICWDCHALFKEAPDGSVIMDECMCGRHDDGKVIKREEVKEHGD